MVDAIALAFDVGLFAWLYVLARGQHAMGRTVETIDARLGGLEYDVDANKQRLERLVAGDRQWINSRFDSLARHLDRALEDLRANA